VSAHLQLNTNEPHPRPPNYLFIPKPSDLRDEYERGKPVTHIFPLNGIALNSHRDEFAVAFERRELEQRVSDLVSDHLTNDEIRSKYHLSDTKEFILARTREALRIPNKQGSVIVPCLYRPFDFRFLLFHPEILDRPRPELNSHFLNHDNIGLATTRQTREPFAALIVNKICGQHKIVARYDGTSIFPLYVYASGHQLNFEELPPNQVRQANLSSEFVSALETKLDLSFVADRPGDGKNTVGPENIINYVYAVLYSASFRTRYPEFLSTDFPRIPITASKELFQSLAQKGSELVSLHLMESPRLSQFITRYEQPGDHIVDRVAYVEANPKAGIKSGRVYINSKQYFEDVPKEGWEFHIGGYQVCEKWLKDRKGRKLSSDDIDHYQKIVVALSETIRIMKEIDEIIPGWPLP
jgi:predicted helicase